MPLFHLKDPMPHLEDATFSYDENPDPERYDEVASEPEAVVAPPAAEAAGESQTEEN